MTRNSAHSNCDHESTKAARAACRRQRKTRVSSFMIEEALAMNEMWSKLNSAQERLMDRYRVIHTTCEYCDDHTTTFVFPHLGINVCAACERTYSVHTYEEEI